MKKTIEIIPPSIPDYVSIEQPVGKREDGFKPNPGLHIRELSEEEANQYADLWKELFLSKWRLEKKKQLTP